MTRTYTDGLYSDGYYSDPTPAPGGVSRFTARLFSRLPELYRAGDEAQSFRPLLRYIDSLGAQADLLEDVLDRLLLHPGAPDGLWRSDLSDPAEADDSWLGWLAQLAGLQVLLGSTAAGAWSQIVLDFASWDDLDFDQPTWAAVSGYGGTLVTNGPATVRGWLIAALEHGLAWGSTWAWEEAIRPHLTGARTVIHQRIVAGDPWHLQLETYEHETPFPDRVEAAIAAVPKPAGLAVTYATRPGGAWSYLEPAGYETWGMVLAAFPTWDDLSDWIP